MGILGLCLAGLYDRVRLDKTTDHLEENLDGIGQNQQTVATEKINIK